MECQTDFDHCSFQKQATLEECEPTPPVPTKHFFGSSSSVATRDLQKKGKKTRPASQVVSVVPFLLGDILSEEGISLKKYPPVNKHSIAMENPHLE